MTKGTSVQIGQGENPMHLSGQGKGSPAEQLQAMSLLTGETKSGLVRRLITQEYVAFRLERVLASLMLIVKTIDTRSKPTPALRKVRKIAASALKEE